MILMIKYLESHKKNKKEEQILIVINIIFVEFPWKIEEYIVFLYTRKKRIPKDSCWLEVNINYFNKISN